MIKNCAGDKDASLTQRRKEFRKHKNLFATLRILAALREAIFLAKTQRVYTQGAKNEFYVVLLAEENFLALNQIISPGNITAKEINISVELPLNNFITIPRMNKINPVIINAVPAVL